MIDVTGLTSYILTCLFRKSINSLNSLELPPVIRVIRVVIQGYYIQGEHTHRVDIKGYYMGLPGLLYKIIRVIRVVTGRAESLHLIFGHHDPHQPQHLGLAGLSYE